MELVITGMYVIAILLLLASGFVAVERIAAGPSQLDRTVASDLLVAIVIGAVGVWAALSNQDTEITVLLVLSMLGFTGAVSISRMVGERIVYRPKTEEKKSDESIKEGQQ